MKAINKAIIDRAISEGVVKKNMEIDINDFDIQDTYLTRSMNACEICK